MIVLIYGTTAELVKLAPVHRRLSELGARPQLWCTAQQLDELPEATELLGLPQPDRMLGSGAGGHSLRTIGDSVRWLTKLVVGAMWKYPAMWRALRSDGVRPLVIVHGDTMTTVIGAVLGRALGARVAHVEAGLRSHDWKHPFPEEIDRRLVGRIAQLHYAPGPAEAGNIKPSKRRRVVVTNGNTVQDSVRMVPASASAGVDDLPEEFGLVSLHRLELLQDGCFSESLELLQEAARRIPLVMVFDPVTDEQIKRQGLERVFDDVHFRRIPKLSYFRFISLLRRAGFVVTDSGGLQEECAFVGKPCLVHRKKTERSDGLGTNVQLSGMDNEVLRRFLLDPFALRAEPASSDSSPSQVIVDDLVAHGFTARPRATAD